MWGNDHMTTQRYVQREWREPPSFYEPLIIFSYVAARTTRIRLATGIIVLPMRTMPVLAKQAATLDQLSGGRLILGRGHGRLPRGVRGARPRRQGARRGDIVEEGMRALRLLFTERKATFRGKHVRFEEVECFPKPRQTPLPIYAGGNHAEVRRRAGEYGEGWMPAVLSPEEIRAGRRGRSPGSRPGRARGGSHRHRAAVRLLHRPHPRGGRAPLPRLPALQTSRVAQAVDAARSADGRVRAAKPHRQPVGDL